MSNKYEMSKAKVPEKKSATLPTTQEPPSTYEKIGVLDVSVYSHCEYPKETTTSGQIGVFKGVQKKRVLCLVCGVAVAVLVVLSLVLGVAGLARKGCCSATAKCKVEEISGTITAPNTTTLVQMDIEGYSIISAYCVHRANRSSHVQVMTSLQHHSSEESVSCTCNTSEPATYDATDDAAPLHCMLRVTRCPIDFFEQS